MLERETVGEYFDLDQVAQRLGCTRRHAHRILKDVAPGLTRNVPTSGRPRKLYHYTAHPKLLADAFLAERAQPEQVAQQQGRAVAQDDLAVAMLRAQAVEEYRALCTRGSEGRAAAVTCADWCAAPRRKVVRFDERMPGQRKGKVEIVVQVGPFSTRTLRTWASLYKDKLNILALVPERKEASGRPQKEIPSQLIDIIHTLACSTPRADIRKAIAKAKEVWPGDWPEVGYATLRARLRERDPEKFCETLGKRGISQFRMEHSPDCERDYSSLRYNQLWQLDDVTMDFYGHGLDPKQILRPYAYAIIRVSTRQWICAVTCETPITQDQVRSLLGLALADPQGGVPEEITFERGTVACDDYLRDLLETLGIKVHRTSMDGGKVAPGMLADRAKGHFQGKAVQESNNARIHQALWDQPSQVGPRERDTAPARNATLLKYAEACIKNGLKPILPTSGEWQALVFQALEKLNNQPHSGLAEIVAVSDQRSAVSMENLVRHLTPNEHAVQLKDQAMRIMDERLLPLFFERGLLIPVNRNGIRVNNGTYGRFDEELQKLAGTSVMVFAQALIPDVVYIKELGRCVDLFVKPAYGSGDDNLEKKYRIERAKRNQFEALLARTMEAGRQINVDSVKFTSNPVPERVRELLAPAALLERANGIKAARTEHAERTESLNKRFDLNAERGAGSPAHKNRAGLLARAEGLREEVAVLSGGHTRAEDADKFEV